MPTMGELMWPMMLLKIFMFILPGLIFVSLLMFVSVKDYFHLPLEYFGIYIRTIYTIIFLMSIISAHISELVFKSFGYDFILSDHVILEDETTLSKAKDELSKAIREFILEEGTNMQAPRKEMVQNILDALIVPGEFGEHCSASTWQDEKQDFREGFLV